MALINTIRSALASVEVSIVGGEQEALSPPTDIIEKPEAKSPSRESGNPAPAKLTVVGSKKSTALLSSKTDTILKKLRLARGATVAQLLAVTGWQAHSMRGFLSGVIRKKLGLTLVSEVGKDGIRRYRIVDGADSRVG